MSYLERGGNNDKKHNNGIREVHEQRRKNQILPSVFVRNGVGGGFKKTPIPVVSTSNNPPPPILAASTTSSAASVTSTISTIPRVVTTSPLNHKGLCIPEPTSIPPRANHSGGTDKIQQKTIMKTSTSGSFSEGTANAGFVAPVDTSGFHQPEAMAVDDSDENTVSDEDFQDAKDGLTHHVICCRCKSTINIPFSLAGAELPRGWSFKITTAITAEDMNLICAACSQLDKQHTDLVVENNQVGVLSTPGKRDRGRPRKYPLPLSNGRNGNSPKPDEEATVVVNSLGAAGTIEDRDQDCEQNDPRNEEGAGQEEVDDATPGVLKGKSPDVCQLGGNKPAAKSSTRWDPPDLLSPHQVVALAPWIKCISCQRRRRLPRHLLPTTVDAEGSWSCGSFENLSCEVPDDSWNDLVHHIMTRPEKPASIQSNSSKGFEVYSANTGEPERVITDMEEVNEVLEEIVSTMNGLPQAEMKTNAESPRGRRKESASKRKSRQPPKEKSSGSEHVETSTTYERKGDNSTAPAASPDETVSHEEKMNPSFVNSTASPSKARTTRRSRRSGDVELVSIPYSYSGGMDWDAVRGRWVPKGDSKPARKRRKVNGEPDRASATKSSQPPDEVKSGEVSEEGKLADETGFCERVQDVSTGRARKQDDSKSENEVVDVENHGMSDDVQFLVNEEDDNVESSVRAKHDQHFADGVDNSRESATTSKGGIPSPPLELERDDGIPSQATRSIVVTKNSCSHDSTTSTKADTIPLPPGATLVQEHTSRPPHLSLPHDSKSPMTGQLVPDNDTDRQIESETARNEIPSLRPDITTDTNGQGESNEAGKTVLSSPPVLSAPKGPRQDLPGNDENDTVAPEESETSSDEIPSSGQDKKCGANGQCEGNEAGEAVLSSPPMPSAPTCLKLYVLGNADNDTNPQSEMETAKNDITPSGEVKTTDTGGQGVSKEACKTVLSSSLLLSAPKGPKLDVPGNDDYDPNLPGEKETAKNEMPPSGGGNTTDTSGQGKGSEAVKTVLPSSPRSSAPKDPKLDGPRHDDIERDYQDERETAKNEIPSLRPDITSDTDGRGESNEAGRSVLSSPPVLSASKGPKLDVPGNDENDTVRQQECETANKETPPSGQDEIADASWQCESNEACKTVSSNPPMSSAPSGSTLDVLGTTDNDPNLQGEMETAKNEIAPSCEGNTTGSDGQGVSKEACKTVVSSSPLLSALKGPKLNGSMGAGMMLSDSEGRDQSKDGGKKVEPHSPGLPASRVFKPDKSAVPETQPSEKGKHGAKTQDECNDTTLIAPSRTFQAARDSKRRGEKPSRRKKSVGKNCQVGSNEAAKGTPPQKSGGVVPESVWTSFAAFLSRHEPRFLGKKPSKRNKSLGKSQAESDKAAKVASRKLPAPQNSKPAGTKPSQRKNSVAKQQEGIDETVNIAPPQNLAEGGLGSGCASFEAILLSRYRTPVDRGQGNRLGNQQGAYLPGVNRPPNQQGIGLPGVNRLSNQQGIGLPGVNRLSNQQGIGLPGVNRLPNQQGNCLPGVNGFRNQQSNGLQGVNGFRNQQSNGLQGVTPLSTHLGNGLQGVNLCPNQQGTFTPSIGWIRPGTNASFDTAGTAKKPTVTPLIDESWDVFADAPDDDIVLPSTPPAGAVAFRQSGDKKRKPEDPNRTHGHLNPFIFDSHMFGSQFQLQGKKKPKTFFP